MGLPQRSTPKESMETFSRRTLFSRNISSVSLSLSSYFYLKLILFFIKLQVKTFSVFPKYIFFCKLNDKFTGILRLVCFIIIWWNFELKCFLLIENTTFVSLSYYLIYKLVPFIICWENCKINIFLSSQNTSFVSLRFYFNFIICC